MIITERKRRALKEVIKGKFEAADFKMKSIKSQESSTSGSNVST